MKIFKTELIAAGENKTRLNKLETAVKNGEIKCTDKEYLGLSKFILKVYRDAAAAESTSKRAVTWAELTETEQEVITAAKALKLTDYEDFKKADYVLSILTFLSAETVDKKIYQIFRFKTGKSNMVSSHLDKTFYDLPIFDKVFNSTMGTSLIKMLSYSKTAKMRLNKNDFIPIETETETETEIEIKTA